MGMWLVFNPHTYEDHHACMMHFYPSDRGWSGFVCTTWTSTNASCPPPSSMAHCRSCHLDILLVLPFMGLPTEITLLPKEARFADAVSFFVTSKWHGTNGTALTWHADLVFVIPPAVRLYSAQDKISKKTQISNQESTIKQIKLLIYWAKPPRCEESYKLQK